MNRALCIGVSNYGGVASDLPGVANDVAAVADLLAGDGGAFGGATRLLRDDEATRGEVLVELERALTDASAEQVFIYLAGHGMAAGGKYHFVPRDFQTADPEATAVPLADVRELFDSCPAKRVLLFLDCCHSGGILARGVEPNEQARDVLRRAIQVVGGEGKMIYAACTEEQLSYESTGPGGQGFFTRAMVDGIRGKAASAEGEVTAGALFDYIDRQVERVGHGLQRPMQHGHTAGRMVLIHDAARAIPSATDTQAAAGAVDDSGALVMLGDAFFDDVQVHSTGHELTVVVPSPGATGDAVIEELRPRHHGGGRPVAYAHLNDGGDVRVKDVRSSSEAGRQVWTLTLQRESDERGPMGDFSYNAGGWNFSPLDIAVIKARRVLLGERQEREQYQPGMGRPSAALDPVMVGGHGDQALINQCPLRDLAALKDEDPTSYLRRARLRCLYLLKRIGVVERVLELRLGPVGAAGVPVLFHGRRLKVYDNQAPDEVEIEGVCSIP